MECDRRLCLEEIKLTTDKVLTMAVMLVAAALSSILRNGVDEDWLLLDAASQPFGIETAGGVMSSIIARHSTIPTRQTCIFSTYEDNQPGVVISVCQAVTNRQRGCEVDQL